MSAVSFCIVDKGKTASEAFDSLVVDGAISACSLRGRAAKAYDKYSKENEEDARRYVKSQSFGEEWVANYIDLGVCGYELVEVKRKNRKSDAKFQMMYNVYNNSGERVGSVKNKTSAEQKAMEYALKANEPVFVKKEQTAVSGDSRVCDVTVERKFFEKKPRAPRAPGKELVAIHKFMFYGLVVYKEKRNKEE